MMDLRKTRVVDKPSLVIAREKRQKKLMNQQFLYKGAPIHAIGGQALEIFAIIMEHGKITREKLLIRMGERIKSKQSMKRILTYYASTLEDAECIEIIDAEDV